MLRSRLNLHSYRYGSALFNRIEQTLGYNNGRRFAHDHETVMRRALAARNKLKNSNQFEKFPKCQTQDLRQRQAKTECANVNVLKARECPKTPPPPPPKGNDALKWILGAVAAGALGGAAYLLTQNQTKEQPAAPPVVDKRFTPIPASSADIPNHIPYLLIGGGTASFSAFRAIKSLDARAKVLMVTDEYFKPYMRPPLSKELWYSSEPGKEVDNYRFKQWTGSERSLFFEPEEFFEDVTKLMENPNGGISIAQGYVVKKVDPTTKTATLADGKQITYDQCLIATGCRPKTLNIFEGAAKNVQEKVMVYRTTKDFEKLKAVADTKKSITIVGSGFLGSELACALSSYNNKSLKIKQIFHENGNIAKVLPAYLSKWTSEKLEKQGVEVIPNTDIVEVSRDHEQLKLVLNDGRTVLTDQVVVCVGCEPNTEIAETSGLEVHSGIGGFVVNAELEARRNLFVAGDAACFYDPLLGRRRVEHHDNSVVSGRLAGENMVGQKKPFTHQSMFWSDLGSAVGFEGIGLVDSSLPTVGVFAKNAGERSEKAANSTTEEAKPEPSTEIPENKETPDDFGKGVIFYLKDKKIVGILLWNIFNRIGLARTLLNEDKCYEDLNEVAKLFDIHA